MKKQGALFTIGSLVYFGRDQYRVIRYHKVAGNWEVMFRSLATGSHTSVPITILERSAL